MNADPTRQRPSLVIANGIRGLRFLVFFLAISLLVTAIAAWSALSEWPSVTAVVVPASFLAVCYYSYALLRSGYRIRGGVLYRFNAFSGREVRLTELDRIAAVHIVPNPDSGRLRGLADMLLWSDTPNQESPRLNQFATSLAMKKKYHNGARVALQLSQAFVPTVVRTKTLSRKSRTKLRDAFIQSGLRPRDEGKDYPLVRTGTPPPG